MQFFWFGAGIALGAALVSLNGRRDALTGLLTRHAIPRWLLLHRGPLTAIVADLDGLKAINDRCGHAAGDVAIAGLAASIRGAVRRADLVVRYGGDEVLVLSGTAEPDALAARMRRAIWRAGIAASVGLASGPAGSLPTLIARADHEMYRSKGERRRGGDRSLAGAVCPDTRADGDPRHRRAGAR